MNLKIFYSTCLILFASQLYGQGNYQWINKEDSVKIYHGSEKYQVKTFRQDFKAKKPKNIIMMIGDGMGVTHVFAALTANGGHLFLENLKHIGFSKTQPASGYITDSAAGGTALSTGKKTFNGAIGVFVNAEGDTVAAKTVLEMAEEKGLSTGLVATSSITHATPAAFVSHQYSRNLDEAIAEDITNSGVDVFIGGGYRFFAERKDGQDLIADLKQKGYQVLQEMDQISKVKLGKLAGLTVPESNEPFPQRKMDLPLSTETALNILNTNKKGLFLMVEGSQIDWGAHQHNTIYTVQEMLDFDRAIGKALEFAAKDGETLIVVTADHETGGLAILNGNMESGNVKGGYSTGSHTGVMVPVFAYGPGADRFTGIMENTDIGKKIFSLLE